MTDNLEQELPSVGDPLKDALYRLSYDFYVLDKVDPETIANVLAAFEAQEAA